MSLHAPLNNFNGGEFSPLLKGRFDLAKHRSGCVLMENFIPRVFGGAHSRPGMIYRGGAKSNTEANKTRLVEFEFSETTRLVLEFGNLYVRFWKDGEQVMHNGTAPTWALTSAWATSTVYVVGNVRAHNGVIYTCIDGHTSGASTEPGVGASWETKWTAGATYSYQRGDFVKRSGLLFYCITTHISLSATEPQAGGSWATYWVRQDIYERPSPFTTAQLFEFQYNQLNDWTYFVHPSVHPYKLVRLADDEWTFEPVDWTYPPFGDENVTTATLAVSATTGAGVTLTASADTFDALHVGAFFALSHRRENANINHNLDLTDSTSATLRMTGDWQLFTYENWSGKLHLDRSLDNGTTWETIRTFEGKNDRNISTNGNVATEALFRLRYDSDGSMPSGVTADGRAVFEAVDSKITGYVKITAVTNATTATGDVVVSPASTAATKLWREGAWSNYRGYPRSITFHEQRLVYGGSRSYPRRVWLSETANVDQFRFGSLDTDAFTYQLSGKANAIQWLASIQGVAIGTLGDELVMTGSSAQDPLTPKDPNAPKQSSRGSAYLPAVLADDVVLFVQSDKRTVREFVFEFSKGGYVSQPMTLLAEHVTKGGIVQMALQQKPETIVWCVTSDGALIGMTYERGQEVVAWHRHPTAGFVESVAVISGTPPGADEVWICVRRTINGQVKRYLETLDPDHWTKVEAGDKDNFICADSAIVKTLGSGTTVSGLDHLEGCEVSVLTDGAVHPSRTVAGGEIELQREATTVVVGLPFTAKLQPNELESDLPDGSSFGRKRRINRLVVQFWQSFGCEVRQNGLEWDRLELRDVEAPMDDSPPPFTGQREINLEGRHENGASLQIRQVQPMPLNILALCAKLDVHGD